MIRRARWASAVLAPLAACASTGVAVADDAGYEEHNLTVRAQCLKRGTGGCTDHLNENWRCVDIPAGYMASTDPRTFSARFVNQYGRATHCPHRFEDVSTMPTPFGPVDVAGRVCLSAHVESGGGGGGIGQTFFNDCALTYRIAPRP